MGKNFPVQFNKDDWEMCGTDGGTMLTPRMVDSFRRLAVPGGWLVKADFCTVPVTRTVVFVPDPDHTWLSQ